jgi:hypothetical protein
LPEELIRPGSPMQSSARTKLYAGKVIFQMIDAVTRNITLQKQEDNHAIQFGV